MGRYVESNAKNSDSSNSSNKSSTRNILYLKIFSEQISQKSPQRWIIQEKSLIQKRIVLNHMYSDFRYSNLTKVWKQKDEKCSFLQFTTQQSCTKKNIRISLIYETVFFFISDTINLFWIVWWENCYIKNKDTLKPRYSEQVRQTLFVHYIE